MAPAASARILNAANNSSSWGMAASLPRADFADEAFQVHAFEGFGTRGAESGGEIVQGGAQELVLQSTMQSYLVVFEVVCGG